MSDQESPPTSNVKSIRDFVKSGTIVVIILFIGILVEGLLHIPTIAGYMVGDAIYGLYFDELALVLGYFVVIIIYVSFMSFIGYMSSISNHKFGKLALGALHKLLIVVLCLIVLFILFLPAAY